MPDLVLVLSAPTGAGEVRGGQGHGQPHQRLRLPGVLGQDEGRRAGGVRDGHQGGAAGQEAGQEGRLQPAIGGLEPDSKHSSWSVATAGRFSSA